MRHKASLFNLNRSCFSGNKKTILRNIYDAIASKNHDTSAINSENIISNVTH